MTVRELIEALSETPLTDLDGEVKIQFSYDNGLGCGEGSIVAIETFPKRWVFDTQLNGRVILFTRDE